MADKYEHLPIPLPKNVELPSSAGLGENEWFTSYSRTEVAEADTEFVEQDARFRRARTAQVHATIGLVVARFELGKVIARLGALEQVVRDEFVLAHTQRKHQQRMADLAHVTAELQAQARLLEAKHARDALIPKPAPAPTPQLPAPGLTAKEISEVLSVMPDLSDDQRATLRNVLDAALDEKSRS